MAETESRATGPVGHENEENGASSAPHRETVAPDAAVDPKGGGAAGVGGGGSSFAEYPAASVPDHGHEHRTPRMGTIICGAVFLVIGVLSLLMLVPGFAGLRIDPGLVVVSVVVAVGLILLVSGIVAATRQRKRV